ETHVRSLRVGQEVDRQQLRAWFADEGFSITDYVYQPGEVAFRGSIVDIFAYNAERPIRLDFFDTEIESIRSFDIDTQLSHEKLEEVTLSSNLANMAGGGQSLFSFLSQDYTLLFTDYEAALGRITQLYQEEAVLVEGEGFSSTEEMRAKLIALETLPQEIHGHRLILGMLPSGIVPAQTVEFATLPQPLFHKNFDLLIEGLKHYKEKGYRVWFLTESTPQAERLREILSDLGEASLMPEPLPLTLHEGFEDADSAMVFLTDHQIFERYHKYRLQSDRIRTGGVSLSLKELKSFTPGDFIVHYDHGIGRFAGLFTQRDGEKQQEVVKIDYRDGAYILVSVHNLRKLSKYRNRDDEPPKLSELGGGAWNRLKERTKKRVKDIARDLIRLYAARRESEGFAFSPDSYLQHELEASFIYEETPDQLKAMEAVKQDMEQPRPMDRLICGDVGFGKTEIAIRAAFKAVADSKQVAVLVPTTILAYQHYRTFSERLKDLPVRVAYFSRAQSAKESKQLLEDLKEGKIDIVVGTHRLVGKNVQFKDLGLLVIDEEQKFGVAVKEKLRSLQVNVDTLTMSATPIPRTLQFSLMGTRDLSNILTPPRNRYPVATEVIRFDPEAIAEAINFELSRNGQVFFVHNRIDDIEGIARMIQQRIPDCRIAVGHGRMNQTELEQLFVSFSQHEFDVLVSTTIVENGIDVSNANTIIIDSAHHFGLSDLHQLRGRVGRSSRKAFCYLITPP
ncbi:MAG: DEAD/DEAH box helicase, partial [Porphyromonas endodontalis]